ncbi:MAG TPA: alpha/beta fold hydrolase, partial [Alphaproteobacteria bacterium]
MGRPVFLIPGVYGVVAEMKPLAQALCSGRPVYGLQPRGFDPGRMPDDRIEDMARHYIQEIRTVQPRGPYALVGFSFGGHIAFEMAHQLRAAGEDIELLALLDAPMHRRYLPGLARARFRLSRAGRALRRLTARQRDERLPHPWRALREWRDR